MKFPILKTSNLKNIVIIIISLFISAFLLLFGIANLINPDVADVYLLQNTIMCIVLCVLGISFILIAIASLRGIIYRNKNKS